MRRHSGTCRSVIELVIWISPPVIGVRGSREAARLGLRPDGLNAEMYVWSDTDQIFKDARSVFFTDTEKSNWTCGRRRRRTSGIRFFSHQQDLNWESPLVIEEVLKAIRFLAGYQNRRMLSSGRNSLPRL